VGRHPHPRPARHPGRRPVPVLRTAARPVDLTPYVCHHECGTRAGGLPGTTGNARVLDCSALDWVIVGGESGPGARPMHPDWARSLRDQCQAAGVPYFFKQWGSTYDGYPEVDRG
jgi:hypothetical protein